MRPLPFLACVKTDFARAAAPVRPRLRSQECLSALRQIAFALGVPMDPGSGPSSIVLSVRTVALVTSRVHTLLVKVAICCV